MDDRRRGSTAVVGTRTGRREELAATIKAAVAEAVSEKELREQEEARKKPGKRSLASAFLVVVLLGFAASGLYAYFEVRTMSVPLEEEMGLEAGAVGVHLYSMAVRLDAFRQENGHYPSTLDLAGIPADESLEYTLLSGGEYNLRYRHGDILRTYRSTHPPSTLLRPRADIRN